MHKDITTNTVYWNAVGIFKTQTSKDGNLYALQLDESTGRWEYAKGAIHKLQPQTKVTIEQASAYGRKTGRCMICGRLLTNPESVERGIGPICAGGL